jgi:hypothetical protein
MDNDETEGMDGEYQDPEWMKDLSQRERDEINFCMVYSEQFNHGTDGHTRLLMVAKLAKKLDAMELAQKPKP